MAARLAPHMPPLRAEEAEGARLQRDRKVIALRPTRPPAKTMLQSAPLRRAACG